MKAHWVTALLTVALFTTSCTAGPVPPPAQVGCGPRVATEEDAIHEAALRQLFALNRDSEPTSSRVLIKYFVGVAKGPEPGHDDVLVDPPSSLVARFATNNPVVKPLSSAPMPRGWPSSDLWDHVFVVGDICWKGRNEVEVSAGLRPRFPGDVYYVMKLRQQADKWVVTSYEYTGGR